MSLAAAAQARPYYAARKTLNCAACHINPAGGGSRWPTQQSPVRINDSINVGADFRVAGAKSQGGHAANPSSFSVPEAALYVMARPSDQLALVYDNFNAFTAEAYAKWTTDKFYDLPVYLRAGRFRVPYGLQVDDIDQATAAYVKNVLFSPPSGVGFRMNTNDTGLEVGLDPKKGYFANLSVTNGSGNQSTNEAKAWTARLGVITKHLALGLTGFRNHPLGAASSLEERGGFFGWASWWKLALLGEWGIGRDKPNAPLAGPRPPSRHRRAGYAELDLDLITDVLLGKLKYDLVNPNTESSANANRRYTMGLEWFATPNSSVEAQWRILTESPEVKNNQGVVAAHVWF